MSKRARGLEWDDMRFFLAIYRLGTLSAASHQLGVDHTTVARRIERLELALNASLFERKNTGYEPTVAGERLLSSAEAMEAAMMTAEVKVGDRNLSLAGVVRIGAPDGFGSLFLAPRLRTLCDAHPLLEVELIATARIFSLTKREADIAISLASPQQGRVLGRRLVDYRLGLYSARDYINSMPEIRCLDDLGKHRFIGYIEDLLFAPELNLLPRLAGDIVPRIKSANLIAQLQATLSGAGLAILPAFMAHQFGSLVPVLENDFRIYRSFYLHLHEDNRRIARVRETADFIAQQVQEAKSLFDPPQ